MALRRLRILSSKAAGPGPFGCPACTGPHAVAAGPPWRCQGASMAAQAAAVPRAEEATGEVAGRRHPTGIPAGTAGLAAGARAAAAALAAQDA
eukprot:1720015-Lingulodinium_polyedra.AAC.1